MWDLQRKDVRAKMVEVTIENVLETEATSKRSLVMFLALSPLMVPNVTFLRV